MLNGTTRSWELLEPNGNDATNLYYCGVARYVCKTGNEVISSKLPSANIINVVRTENGIQLNVGYMEVIYTRVRKDTGITSLDEWVAALDAEPLEVLLPIDPIETPLTAEELDAYRALYTNHHHTTVYTDEGAGIALDYTADTKTYIDKKFAELAAAIINN